MLPRVPKSVEDLPVSVALEFAEVSVEWEKFWDEDELAIGGFWFWIQTTKRLVSVK